MPQAENLFTGQGKIISVIISFFPVKIFISPEMIFVMSRCSTASSIIVYTKRRGESGNCWSSSVQNDQIIGTSSTVSTRLMMLSGSPILTKSVKR